MRSALADLRSLKAGRPLLWAAGLSLFVVLAVLAAVVLREPQQDVRPRSVDVVRASPAAASAALADFVVGVQARDAVALTDLAPPEDEAAASLLQAVADNARLVELGDFTARYVDQVGTVAADGSWTGVVEMTWRFGDFDPSPARADVPVSFAPDGEELGITGFGAESASTRGRTPLWLRGPLSVVATSEALVLVDGTRAEAEQVAGRVARGIDVVHRVLPDWEPRVVVEVPASASALNGSLGAAPGTYDAIAAVTASVDGSTAGDAPVHVYVNPEVTAGLRRAGSQVVMSHELVHVATGAATNAVEPWLVEGFADYIALRDVSLPDRTTLGRAIDVARREGVPRALPSAADFDTRAADLQARYEEAWLACRIIAERLGTRALATLYDKAAAGVPVERALERAGLTQRALTREWRTRLQGLAG